jgi:Cys-tRNA(Pro)/Cys-tRNA(Cys) deacylase
MAQTTNVMRLLTAAGLEFGTRSYNPSITDGLLVAEALGENPEQVFKTLVTEADGGVGTGGHGCQHFVFVIPVNCTLDLKKAAKAAGVKSIQMIKQKELLPLTGYIHGGCSPIGMKKPFKTCIEESATLYDSIFVSAGQVGHQIEINPLSLQEYVGADFADLV